MSSYRPLGAFPQYFLADGTVNNGGFIHFYETDLTTPKDTYSDDGLTVLNSNPVVLDSAGRPNTDIWGNGAYGVVITDALGANPRTLNNVQPDSGTTTNIPSLVSGDFLTNNGSVLLWSPVSQVPDPTGFSGDVLYTDGTLTYWGAIPTPTDISGTSEKIIVGDVKIQWGSGNFPVTNLNYTQLAINYPESFSGAPYFVSVNANSQTPTAIEQVLICNAFTPTASGFTAYGDTNASDLSHPIINSIPFSWVAIGPK